MQLLVHASLTLSSLTSSGFLPHGYCYLWNKPLLWTHLTSDLIIGISYVVISVSLAVLMHRVSRDVPFSILFIAFGLFIIACGMTHFMEVLTLWRPYYWAAGGVKVVTAVASVTTAAVIPFIVPQVHETVRQAKQSRLRELAAERSAALEETNGLLQSQALELEYQAEKAQNAARELEQANAQLQATLREVQASRDEAERARRKMAYVLDNMADGYVVVDRDWSILAVNQATARMNGKPASALIGRTPWEEWPTMAGTILEQKCRQVMTTQISEHFEYHYHVEHEPESWIELDVYPAESGGLTIFFRDITLERTSAAERERLLEAERVARADAERERREAEEARQNAEVANTAKGQFLAAMSHELRTPLNAICGYVELLELGLRGPLTSEQLLDLDRIKTNQQHLLSLINDILNFTQLGAGRIEYRIGSVPVDLSLRTTETMIMPQVLSAGLDYVYEGCDPMLCVSADPDKMHQILVNLLGNAIKFTPRGGQIRVTCESEAQLVRIRVTDTGIGIPADKLEAIFDPFVQTERRLNQPVEGIGLGLAISRELARRMGGNLTARSEAGQGAIFTLVLSQTTSNELVAPYKRLPADLHV